MAIASVHTRLSGRWSAFRTIVVPTLACICAASSAHATPDPHELIQASALAMGGTAPATSDVSANITIVEGGATRNGTIRLRTRGLNETSEVISAQVPEVRTYNGGFALETRGDLTKPASNERAIGLYSVHFPLVLLQALLDDPETNYEYVGPDTVNDTATHHVQVHKTYASQPEIQFLSEVAVKDIWLDWTTLFPVKVSFRRFEGRGAVYPVPVEFSYSSFQSVSGKVFPFHIEQSLNGTVWATISSPVITLDAPIDDAVFAVR